MDFIKIAYPTDQTALPIKYGDFCNKLPFASSGLLHLPVISAKLLTEGLDVKPVLEITLHLKQCSSADFEPGDTIGVLPQNDPNEVQQIIQLLNLARADEIVHISAEKKALPSHISQVTTIRSLLTNNLDLRAVPKKKFFKMLQNHTTDAEEAKELEGIELIPNKYVEFIEETPFLLQILQKFPNTKPPFEKILPFLPSLKPRPYSICSSPLCGSFLSFVVTLVDLKANFRGVCSSFLHNLALEPLTNVTVPVYFRNPSNFRLPKDFRAPILMIGAGSGVAPFLGFLRHVSLQGNGGNFQENSDNSTENLEHFQKNMENLIKMQENCKNSQRNPENSAQMKENYKNMQENVQKNNETAVKMQKNTENTEENAENPPKTTENPQKNPKTPQKPHFSLYFGCRYASRDFLYAEELSKFASTGFLNHLRVAFSRENASKKVYVQDLLLQNAAEVVTQCWDNGGAVFVCGDVQNMGKDVEKALAECLSVVKGWDGERATEMLRKLQEEGRYVKDLWI